MIQPSTPLANRLHRLRRSRGLRAALVGAQLVLLLLAVRPDVTA